MSTGISPRRAALALLAAFVAFDGAWAAPAPAEPPKPIPLKLESGANLGPGSVAVAEGVANPASVRFVVEGLDVAQPVTVVVSSADASTPLSIAVAKDSFVDPQRTAQTTADGTATVQFRTQGDFGISITGNTGTPFLLAVWAGQPSAVATPTFLSPVASYDTAAPASSALAPAATSAPEVRPVPVAAPASSGVAFFQIALLAIGLLIAAGLLLVAVALFRRRPEGAAAGAGPLALLLVAILGASVQARAPQPDPTPGARQVPAASILDLSGRWAAADSRTAHALRDGLDRSRSVYNDALGGGLQAINIAEQAWQVLHPSDQTCIAQTAPASMPVVPSQCANSEGCASCYSQAFGRLNRTRANLEKLRCIYRSNEEYAERATSFGDNVSSIHGISGLAWQQERRKIERAVGQLGQTYDRKYRELLGYAREDLASIGACEARHYDNPDWATRYGFIFYGFLEDRYRR